MSEPAANPSRREESPQSAQRTGLVGQTLGGYRILQKIGEGGMGSVFRAIDEGLDRPVAIKVLPPSLAREESFRARFLREARALARVKHPNLVQVYSVAVEKGLHFFAMEFVEGESLAAVIKRSGPLPLERILSVGGQILSALDAVHAAGITHRDVKSANIMIDSAGRAVLMDLGLAKDEASKGLTTAGVILGTPEYMSPEQAEGNPTTPQSDIYSFGVVLYEMAAGAVPFRGKSAIAILRQQCDEEPPSLAAARPDLPAPFVEAVSAAMRKRPEERPRGARALAAMLLGAGRTPELEALAAGLPSGQSWSRSPTLVDSATGATLQQPREAEPGERTLRAESARSRALAWLVAFAALAVVAAGIAWGRHLARSRAKAVSPSRTAPAEPAAPKHVGRPAAVYVAGEELFPGRRVTVVPGGITSRHVTVRLDDGSVKTIPHESRPEIRYLEPAAEKSGR